MILWTDVECETCFGFGTVLPDPEGELELCPDCRGTGRVAERDEYAGFIGRMIAVELLRDGATFRTRRECLKFIEDAYM